MKLIEVIFPGIGFFCAMTLLILGLLQTRLFFKEKAQRSKYLALFCFASGVFTLHEVVVYSEQFSVEITRYYVIGFQFLLFVGLYFYFKSLSFFIMIPKWIKKFYSGAMVLFACLALIPPFALFFFGKYLYFNPENLQTTGRYFVDAYTSRLGVPFLAPMIVLSLFSIVHASTSFFLLVRLLKSSRDLFLMFGMLFNILGCGMEFLALPFTIDYYIPLIFLANIFEALRMSHLATRESLGLSSENRDGSVEKKKMESYKNISFDEDRLEKLAQSLTRLMENDKLYLNPNLQISDLGRKLQMPDYLVSQGIRFSLQSNFYQWVSTYRIQEVKKRLSSDESENKTIMDIVFESGFNSKSSFNSAFKRIVGVTPSQFRESKI